MSEKIAPTQLALYHSPTCPFCHIVFDALRNLGFPPKLSNGNAGDIALKDRSDKQNASDLIAGGGKRSVPCLRIERDGKHEWMYESADIVAFLQANLG